MQAVEVPGECEGSRTRILQECLLTESRAIRPNRTRTARGLMNPFITHTLTTPSTDVTSLSNTHTLQLPPGGAHGDWSGSLPLDGAALAELPRAARLRRAAVAMAVASEGDGSTGGGPRLVTPASSILQLPVNTQKLLCLVCHRHVAYVGVGVPCRACGRRTPSTVASITTTRKRSKRHGTSRTR